MRQIKSDSSLKPEISLAKKEDLPALIELDKMCMKEEEFNKKQWEYLLLKAKSLVFIASIDGNIIGSMVILLRKHIANARIYILNVHPAYRRAGIGKLLMDTSLKFLKDRGYRKITIETGINNQASINLYMSKGFKIDKILKKYYKSGEDAKHLVLCLTKKIFK
jgi:[ribosomal protein S18]-alanine N-acetyltransferase